MKIKTTLKFHLMTIRMVRINKTTENKRKAVGEGEPSFTVSGTGNWCSPSRNQYGKFSKIKRKPTIWPSQTLFVICPQDSHPTPQILD